MKKLIATVMIVCFLALSLSGCGDPKIIKGKKIPTYGFINEDTAKYDGVKYEVSIGNVVWSIILIETIFAPIYFLGFSLYEPVGVDNGDRNSLTDE